MKSTTLILALGRALLIVSLVGLLFAIGNLIALPSVERQIIEVAPSATAAVADASAQSRRKSFIAIGVCTATLLCALALISSGRKKCAA